MKRFLIGAFVVVSLFATVSVANAQNVTGGACIQVAGGQIFPAQSFRVKFCKIDGNGNLIPGACRTSNPTLANGFFGFDVGNGPGFYYMFQWRDAIFWGSEDYPLAGPIPISNSPFGNPLNGLPCSRPRALPPVAVNPANNAVNRPTSFTLQWSDGLDANRRDPGWIIKYDIYASGNEFPENLIFSDIPCNGVGTCSVNVSGLVYSTRYQWRVVAKLKSPVIFPSFGDNLYLTSSDTLRFSTMFDPSTPTYSFRTSNGKYLTAPNGGGGDFTATASNIDSLISQFKIIDVNGGSLMSGDTVHIQTNKNYYLMAFGGGGGDVATSGWAMSWETFTILKVGGSGAISGGNSVALLGPNGVHYLVAEGGGGGTVNCNRTAIGPFETFTLVQQ